MKIKILFVLIISSLFSYSQQEKLNQLDTEGKKDGKWIIYLDDSWKKVKDTNMAVYCRYNFYDHGANLNPMGPCKTKKEKLESSNNGGIQRGKMKLLDGEYKTIDEKGNVRFIFILKNGEFVSYKEFYANGIISAWFDYTKNWEGLPHSYFITTYDKKGNVNSQGYFRKNDNGQWPPTRD